MTHCKPDFRKATAAALGAVLLLVSPGALAADNAFSGNGPFGGRATSVVFDPSDSTRAYSLGYRNGMFYSDDGGATWQRFNVDHPDMNLGAISSFAIDPNAPSTIWVVDGGGEVARSTDRGVTWTASTTGLASGLHTLTADQANSGTLFADNTSNLFRSTDNGDTWTDVTTGLGTSPRQSIMQSASDPSTFMALGWDGPFKSTDGGQTWAQVANTLPLTNNGYVFARYGVFDPGNSDIALINVSNEGNWRTLDGGATWAPYGTGVPNDFFTEMVRDPSNSSRIYMGTGNNDVIVSTNDGLSWGAADLSGLGEYTVNDIAFNPADSTSMLIATATKGIYASPDSGANWSLSTEGFVNIGVEAIAIDANDGRIYAATTGGTATSNDDGQTWSSNSGDYDLWSFAMEADPLLADHAYAGSGCCGLYETFNGGQTWDRIDLQLPTVVATWVTDIDIPASNPQQLLFSDYNRGLFGTTDAGATWAQLSTGLEPFFTGNVVLEGVDAAETNNNIVFVVSADFQKGGVFRSDDFGASWTRKSGDGVAGPTRAYAIVIHPENPNIVFAGGNSLHRSIDGGDNWTLPAMGVSGIVVSIDFDRDNPQLMYAVSENNGLYRSVDGGNSWTQAPDDGVTSRANHLVMDPTDRGRVLVGYDDVGYQEITFSTDLELANQSGALTGTAGEALSVAMTVTTIGPIDANGVTFETTIPTDFTIDSAVADTGACAIDGQDISCSLGMLAVSASSGVDLSLTAMTDGDYNLTASVGSFESDPDVLNNQVSVSITVGSVIDSDGDGIADSIDNCTDVANADQTDADADGYGNACDADFNNDCVINFIDIAQFANEFLGTNALYDINSDGSVNFLDFVVVSQEFLQTPGPGQGVCD